MKRIGYEFVLKLILAIPAVGSRGVAHGIMMEAARAYLQTNPERKKGKKGPREDRGKGKRRKGKGKQI